MMLNRGNNLENLSTTFLVLAMLFLGMSCFVGGAAVANTMNSPDEPPLPLTELIEYKLRPEVFRVIPRGNTLYVRYKVRDYVVTVRGAQ